VTAIDRRPDLYRAFDHAAEIVAGIEASQLRAPTPCSPWDVSALIDHTVMAANRVVGIGRGDEPRDTGTPHVELTDGPDVLRQAGKASREAWSDDARLSMETTMPWGETYNGATLVDMYLAELAAHTWDLAVATGQTGRLDPALAEPALKAARAMLKPEYRNAMGKGNPFGSEIDPPADATPWEQFAAFMGRRPR
jgi:uncharacterized protein (TIGR03086 family)